MKAAKRFVNGAEKPERKLKTKAYKSINAIKRPDNG